MRWDVVLAAVAFLAPGYLGITTWDWTLGNRSSPHYDTIARALVLSLVWYAVGEALGCVDLASIVDEGSNVISLVKLLQPRNVRFFLAMNFANLIGIPLLAHFVWPRIERLRGRSSNDSTWGDIFRDVPANEYTLTVSYANGWQWSGQAEWIPEVSKEREFLSLQHPYLFDTKLDDWVAQPYDRVVIPVDGIIHVLMKSASGVVAEPGEADDNQGEGNFWISEGRELQGEDRCLSAAPSSETSAGSRVELLLDRDHPEGIVRSERRVCKVPSRDLDMEID